MRIILLAIFIIAILENNVADHQQFCFRSHPKESEGEIQLRNYEPNLFCSATLSAPNAHGINLEITHMDVSAKLSNMKCII
ncbi:unnamed protein product [Dicrocoelium dendriticum]|nr:unnamed protein product [Dicrocoelium dendriticum]